MTFIVGGEWSFQLQLNVFRGLEIWLHGVLFHVDETHIKKYPKIQNLDISKEKNLANWRG